MCKDYILAKANEEMNIIFLQLKLEAIQSWRQFKAGGNFELPQPLACGLNN